MGHIRRRDSSKSRRDRSLPTVESEDETARKLDELHSRDERDTDLSLISQMRLLFLYEENNLAARVGRAHKILSLCEKIFKSGCTGEVFLYFLENGAATSWILQVNLDMPEASTYRALKRLRSLNLVEPAIKLSNVKKSRGGPRPTVWALIGASTEEVARALQLHHRSLSPKYRVAEEIAQSILEDYLVARNIEEISLREIIIHVKELKIPFRTPDIADMAATILHEKGIKVWR